jgi:hypothetical protein
MARVMARRLDKLPHLEALICWEPSTGAELEELLARAAAAQPSAVAGVQTLWVSAAPSDMSTFYMPAVLRSLAHLPSLQVRAS